MLAQVGFAQVPGNSHDELFTEYLDCTGALPPPVEYSNTPSSGRFNVATSVSNRTLIAGMYFGSTELARVGLDWTPSSLDVAFEVQDNNDQGYGGYDNQQTFTSPEWYDGTNFYTDRLALTPNNVADQNETANPPWAIPSPTDPAADWLRLTIGPGSGFSTYDTACRN
jgi:hypothetical protein